MTMEAPDVICLDFETFPIGSRPAYPPKPVGLAVGWPGQEPFYMACGHPTGNNCTEADVLEMLRRCWSSGLPLLFHNAKFDLAVSCEGGGMPMPGWDKVHDTMFLAYLCDPHARQLGLKELAEDLLGWAPEERDAVAEWVMDHSAQLLATYPWNKKTPTQAKITASQVGSWIFSAPAQVVAPYACGDIARTRGLFRHLWPLVMENGMGRSYDRERQILPIFMENERDGICVDLPALEHDAADYQGAIDKAECWLRTTLHASGLNLDADQDVASVLLQQGVVPQENWVMNPSGKGLSVNKDNLRPEHFTGPNGAAVASVLGYRNRLKTCLTMFIDPWLRQASARGGVVSCTWNQVRNPEGGTRTGRPSTQDPNLLNISKDFESKRDDGYVHPEFLLVPHLPLCRRYMKPDKGEVWIHRDFSGQELRVFAHGEQGPLWRAYHADPALDPHAFVGAEFMRVAHREFERTKVKTLNFQGIYGGGIPALQRKLRCTTAEAKELKHFHKQALPGIEVLNDEIKRVVRRGDPIVTWGGRLYYPEKPGYSKKHKRHMTYEYKLINYWVQGSAADLTKQAIIDWHGHPQRIARFLVTVYDEINGSTPTGDAVRQMRILKEAMEENRISVPMLSDPKHGSTWGDAKQCKSVNDNQECPLCA